MMHMLKLYSVCLLTLTLSACLPVLSGSAYADNGPPLLTTHSGGNGAKIILLQQPGLPTRAHMLGLQTTAEALNAMEASGFTITTYDFETKIGTEYGLMKDAQPVSKETLKTQLGELPKGITKDMSSTGHWGNGDYQIQVDNDQDMEYIMSLVKQGLQK